MYEEKYTINTVFSSFQVICSELPITRTFFSFTAEGSSYRDSTALVSPSPLPPKFNGNKATQSDLCGYLLITDGCIRRCDDGCPGKQSC